MEEAEKILFKQTRTETPMVCTRVEAIRESRKDQGINSTVLCIYYSPFPPPTIPQLGHLNQPDVCLC